MFTVDTAINDRILREKDLFKVLFSMNQHQVATPDLSVEDARSYVFFFREDGRVSVYVGLYFIRTGARHYYTHSSNPFPESELPDIEAAARGFTEDLGAMLDELDFSKLSPDEKKQWFDEQEVITGARRESSPQESPAAAAPAEQAAPVPSSGQTEKPSVSAPPAQQPQEPHGSLSEASPQSVTAPALQQTPAVQPAPPIQAAVPTQAPGPIQSPAQPVPSIWPAPVQPPSKTASPVQPSMQSVPPVQTAPGNVPVQSAPQIWPTPVQPEPPLQTTPSPVGPQASAVPAQTSQATPQPRHSPEPSVQTQPAPSQRPAPVSKKSAPHDTVPSEQPCPEDVLAEAVKAGVVKAPKAQLKKDIQTATGPIRREKEALARLLASF